MAKKTKVSFLNQTSCQEQEQHQRNTSTWPAASRLVKISCVAFCRSVHEYLSFHVNPYSYQLLTVFNSFSTFQGARTSRILATNDSTPASPASISPPEWGLDNFAHRESGQYHYGDNDYCPAGYRFLCASEDYSTSSKEISFASISSEQKMKFITYILLYFLLTRPTEANQCSNIIFTGFCKKSQLAREQCSFFFFLNFWW